MAANLIYTNSQPSRNPPPINCRFGERCDNKNNCKFLHPTIPRTPNYNNKKPQTNHIASSKKDTVCVWYMDGQCRNGDNCDYQHPLKTPELKEILEYQKSSTFRPNVEDGMYYRTPNLPGLPELPQNGKCRIMNDKSLVIYFIPFFKPIEGIVYFRKVRLYRLNKQKNQYKLVFNYTKQNFHITTAAASNGYLVCSRLPYDSNVLKLMEEANKLQEQAVIQKDKIAQLKNQNQNLQKKDEFQKNQIAQLKNQNQNLKKKGQAQKKQNDQLKNQNWDLQKKGERITVATSQTITYGRPLMNLNRNIRDNFRTADPIDLFVYDPYHDKDASSFKHVLEYHKPADHVDLNGRTLGLWDQKTREYHTFHIQILTEDVNKYNLDKPVVPEKLCEVF